MDERAKLLQLNDVTGTCFGSEDFSLFLYSLVRMNAPRTVVELGTGLAISALWMALAVKKNGIGHVWTIDDFEFFDRERMHVDEIATQLREAGVISLKTPTAQEYYTEVSRLLNLESYLTFVKARINVNEIGHFDQYPFAGQPVDLLFSDFRHGGREILGILAHFLPRMAPASSIFIHSASSAWTSFLLLEQLCSQLNSGKVPKTLQELCAVDLSEFVRTRRLILVHLTEIKERAFQNSAAWLKVEPVDILPHPLPAMRGMN